MVRTQIQLTEEQAHRLKRLAAERGVSQATIVREALDQILDRDDRAARWDRAMEAVERGGFRSGLADVSVEHDAYLAEDFA